MKHPFLWGFMIGFTTDHQGFQSTLFQSLKTVFHFADNLNTHPHFDFLQTQPKPKNIQTHPNSIFP